MDKYSADATLEEETGFSYHCFIGSAMIPSSRSVKLILVMLQLSDQTFHHPQLHSKQGAFCVSRLDSFCSSGHLLIPQSNQSFSSNANYFARKTPRVLRNHLGQTILN